jgi:hypothetical protein
MHHFTPGSFLLGLLLTLLSGLALPIAALPSSVLGRQLIFPPTIGCEHCIESTGRKWCQRCYMSPVHCTLPFDVPCNATVKEKCPGKIADCIVVPTVAAPTPTLPTPTVNGDITYAPN